MFFVHGLSLPAKKPITMAFPAFGGFIIGKIQWQIKWETGSQPLCPILPAPPDPFAEVRFEHP